jgi:hypothetical protein
MAIEQHSYAVYTDPFELMVHLNMDHRVEPELIDPSDMDTLRAQHEREHIEETPHEPDA